VDVVHDEYVWKLNNDRLHWVDHCLLVNGQSEQGCVLSVEKVYNSSEEVR
jgi:hypothetical protein